MVEIAQDWLAGFKSISLSEMGTVGVNNRIESKFIIPESLLEPMLKILLNDYCILNVNGCIVQSYLTRYFDTGDFRLYLDHHNGRSNRIKVRGRLYESTGDCFWEIKQRVKEYQSIKTRIELSCLPKIVDDALMTGVLEAMPSLEPKLDNHFNRITLCDKLLTERITIDMGIKWCQENKQEALTALAIVEIKQDRFCNSHPLTVWLKERRVHASSFSKYSIGVSKLYPHLKHNNFKPILIYLDKYAATISNY